MNKRILNVTSQYRVTNYGLFSPLRLFLVAVILACILSGLYLGINFVPKKERPLPSPIGRISLPLPESLTGNHVEISGYTKNISPENFIWLVIENREEGICWPQSKLPEANASFSANINAKGHPNAYTVALYTVNQSQNNEFFNWLSAKSVQGFKIPDQNNRLYSVRLWNQKQEY